MQLVGCEHQLPLERRGIARSQIVVVHDKEIAERIDTSGIDLDTVAVARELGIAGKVNAGVYQVSVPRRETIRQEGNEVPSAMGVATAINFQPTGGGKAATTGDFVLRAMLPRQGLGALSRNTARALRHLWKVTPSRAPWVGLSARSCTCGRRLSAGRL